MDSQTALRELQQAQRQQRSASDIYGEQKQQLGVPAAQQRQVDLRNVLRGTEEALRGVESSVSGRTQGSLVTESQRARLANLEREPLAEQFRTQQNALSDEQQLYRDLLGEAGQLAGLEYKTQEDRLAQLTGMYQSALEQDRIRAQQELERRQFEEQMRQFNVEMSARNAEQNRFRQYLDGLLTTPVQSSNKSNKSSNSVPSITLDYSRGLNLPSTGVSGLSGINILSNPGLRLF